MFIALVLVLVHLSLGGSLFTEFVSPNYQLCTVIPAIIDLNPDELLFYLVMVSLGWSVESCNNVEDPFGRICVPNKIEDVNLKVFNRIKRNK